LCLGLIDFSLDVPIKEINLNSNLIPVDTGSNLTSVLHWDIPIDGSTPYGVIKLKRTVIASIDNNRMSWSMKLIEEQETTTEKSEVIKSGFTFIFSLILTNRFPGSQSPITADGGVWVSGNLFCSQRNGVGFNSSVDTILIHVIPAHRLGDGLPVGERGRPARTWRTTRRRWRL